MGTYGAAYKEARDRITALVQSVADDGMGRIVPACPDWTVHSLYSHLAGVAADFTTGNLEAVGRPEWTNAHIHARDRKTVDEITIELTQLGEQIDNVLDNLHPAIAGIFLADTVTHEHDLRGALNKPGPRDTEDLRLALDTYARFFGRRIKENGLDPLMAIAGTQEWELGNEPPQSTLTADSFELYRALGGRRTEAEIKALAWDTSPEPYLEVFSMYGLPERSLDE